MMNTEKLESVAVSAVEGYLDKCSKLEVHIGINDKTPIWDGDVYIYKNKEHKPENFFARVPLQVKRTTIDDDNVFKISREYLEGFKAERGTALFAVQVDDNNTKIFYALLSSKDIEIKLQQTTPTIRIDLNEAPEIPLKFEQRILDFAVKRNREEVGNTSPKEIQELVKGFEEIGEHLNEIENKEARIELEGLLDIIKNIKEDDTKKDDTIGWRDKFYYYSRKAIDLAINNIEKYDFADLQFKLGKYLYDQKQYHLVEDYYLKALKEYRKRADANPISWFKSNVAVALNNLAVLHKYLTRYDEAEKEYEEALEIRRELAKTNRDAYIGNVATTLNNLAILHKNLSRYSEAEKEYKEALEIYRKLAETNRDAYIGDVALTLNNLAVLHYNLTCYDEAEKEFNEALEIRRELAKTNRDAYIGDVALTLNNLGSLHKNLTRYDEAEQEYKEALEIRRELAKNNRDAHIADVATDLNNLAVLHDELNRKDEAEKEYKEALEIRRELAETNRDAYIGDVALTLNNLGSLHDDLTRYDEAEQEYKEALEIRRELAKNNRDAYIEYVATTLNNLAVLHHDLSRYSEAEKEYQEALKIRRELAETNRDAYIGYVAMTLENIARLHKDLTRYDEARESAKEALGIYKELAKAYPQIWKSRVERTERLLDDLSN